MPHLNRCENPLEYFFNRTISQTAKFFEKDLLGVVGEIVKICFAPHLLTNQPTLFQAHTMTRKNSSAGILDTIPLRPPFQNNRTLSLDSVDSVSQQTLKERIEQAKAEQLEYFVFLYKSGNRLVEEDAFAHCRNRITYKKEISPIRSAYPSNGQYYMYNSAKQVFTGLLQEQDVIRTEQLPFSFATLLYANDPDGVPSERGDARYRMGAAFYYGQQDESLGIKLEKNEEAGHHYLWKGYEEDHNINCCLLLYRIYREKNIAEQGLPFLETAEKELPNLQEKTGQYAPIVYQLLHDFHQQSSAEDASQKADHYEELSRKHPLPACGTGRKDLLPEG